MASRRFKKERHPFGHRVPHSSSSEHVSDATLPVLSESVAANLSKKQPKKQNVRVKFPDHEEIPPQHWETAWTPGLRTAVKLLLSARLCSVVWSSISDCDETYNYWEPLHYVLYKTGFQTWEYSPVYALRSYAYILLHSFPMKLYETILTPNRFTMFYFLRLILAILSVAVEGSFYNQVLKRFGPSTARLLLGFLIFSPGMFISATAFLPSSFAMIMTTAAFTAWFAGRDFLATVFIASSAIVGWPFAGILGVPIAFDIIRKKGFFYFVGICIMIGSVIGGTLIAIDTNFYGKFTVAPLNIILYNIISGHGPELYGVEPFYFYLLNGFLNFNFAFCLTLISPIFCIFYFLPFFGPQNKINKIFPNRSWKFFIGIVFSVSIWFGIFFTTPHKEERFLFPVYPLIAFLAAGTLEIISEFPQRIFPASFFTDLYKKIIPYFTALIFVLFVLFGLSRNFALTKFYSAPMNVYMKLQSEALNQTNLKSRINLCVGKEWFRFPSSFFLPDNFDLKFLQSEFRGLLPKPFEKYPEGFSSIPTEMNDENREEIGRYFNLCHCNYLIDFDVEERETLLEPRFSAYKKRLDDCCTGTFFGFFQITSNF